MKTIIISILLLCSSVWAQTSEINLGVINLFSKKNDIATFEISPEYFGKIKISYELRFRTYKCLHFSVNTVNGEFGCLFGEYVSNSKTKSLLLNIADSTTKTELTTQKLKLVVSRVGSQGQMVNYDLSIIEGAHDNIIEKHRFAIIGTKFIIKKIDHLDASIVEGGDLKSELNDGDDFKDEEVQTAKEN